ncbi:MAG: ABC transporter ATP-binding protein/permease [Lentisphaeria bacterium]|nr:ABC transporter ATP-binding protein/permease [Lentisphaeria bacterium]
MLRERKINRKSLLESYERQPLDKIFALFRPYWKMALLTFFFAIAFNMIGLTVPWMLKIAIDRVLPNADYLLFSLLCAAMLTIYLCRCLLRYLLSCTVDYTGIRFVVDVRQRLFKHLQSLSLRFYEAYRTGKLISNVISDVSLVNMMMRMVSALAEQLFQLVLIVVILLVLNWQMALVVLITLPLHFLNFHFSRKIMRADSLVLQEKLSEISANLSETLMGTKVVKSFAKEQAECHRFFRNLRPTVQMQMKVTFDGIGLWSVFDMLAIITQLATIGIGIFFVQNRDITIGEFVAFYTYVNMMIAPIQALSAQVATLAQGMVGASRIVKLLNTIPEIKECAHPIHPDRLTGHIEFQHVQFHYEPDSQPVIQDFSLEIKPGEKVALVGSSGSGKSTLSNLLLRFYDVTGGAILVDGYDVRQLAFESYRSNIGVVLQEPFLFSGTVRDNIAYAREDASMEEIEHAAKMANISEFIKTLPDGYDTIVGENGATLSGGQKQRLAIARAVLKNPSILILDEATSALDTVSEHVVQEALDRLMEGKTTLIIAHRLSTIRNADKIVVLDHGKVMQQGTHEELMATPGIYRELYQTQTRMASR